MRKLLLLCFVFCLAGTNAVVAQDEPDFSPPCPTGKADAYLDVGPVRARILNNGALFWNERPGVYEVPKGSGRHAVFNAALWVGGLDEGRLRFAGTLAGPYEFWPGPRASRPPDCADYDRIYEITRDDLARYNSTGEVTDNLRAWPWHLGAPVLDGDGIPDNYDLAGGDRPALVGHQMLWWVMHDAGGEHHRTGALPIGLEVQATAFAFNLRSHVGHTTFYRYRLVHKGGAALRDAYVGLYIDPDLGNRLDDYFGSDPVLHLGYVYNADDNDDARYGPAPPALGLTLLRGPTAFTGAQPHRLGAASIITFAGCNVCVPEDGAGMYNLMRARWPDGRPLTLGGDGRDSTALPIPFMYPGDPTAGAYWSEVNWHGVLDQSTPGDRHFALSTGPFYLVPGQEQEVVLALVWSRGTSHLDSITRLKIDVARLHDTADDLLAPRVDYVLDSVVPEPRILLDFVQNHPNPFSRATTIRYSLPRTVHVRLVAFDVLGRRVATLVDASQDAGVYDVLFDARHLPSGVYFYRFAIDHHAPFTRHMVLAR